jgi:glutaconate CoA-transferase, subunit A
MQLRPVPLTAVREKIVPLGELRNLVDDGDAVALGGAWLANKPMAAVRELLRAGRRNLHAISVLGSFEIELLVTAAAADRVTFSMVSLDSFGLAPGFRSAVESGTLQVNEMTGLSLEMSIEAAARRLPWMPYPGLGNPPASDLGSASGMFGVVKSPFGGADVLVVRATKPDVAIVHALRSDAMGNAQMDGTFGIDEDLAAAASCVIVTCEELVDRDAITRSSHMTRIPGMLVDYVVEVPFGAHPTSHVPSYSLDGRELFSYVSDPTPQARERYVSVLTEESEKQYRTRVVNDRSSVLAELAASGPVLG